MSLKKVSFTSSFERRRVSKSSLIAITSLYATALRSLPSSALYLLFVSSRFATVSKMFFITSPLSFYLFYFANVFDVAFQVLTALNKLCCLFMLICNIHSLLSNLLGIIYVFIAQFVHNNNSASVYNKPASAYNNSTFVYQNCFLNATILIHLCYVYFCE